MAHKKLKKAWLVAYVIIGLFILALIYDLIATIKLNRKYNSVVSYDSELRRYCEVNGDEYIVVGKCSMINWDISAVVQIFGVYYDEEHPDVCITLEINENKIGVKKCRIGFDCNTNGDWSDDWGSDIYIDDESQPVSKYNEKINEESVEIMKKLKVEVKRAIELANLKWNLGISYSD